MTELDNALTRLFLISVLLVEVKPYETTKKIDKIRKDIRVNLGKVVRKYGRDILIIAKETDAAWLKAINEIDKSKPLTVSLSMMAEILFDTISPNQYRNLFFTDKRFAEAMGSLTGNHAATIEEQEGTYILVDAYLTYMGVPRVKSLAQMIALKRKIKEQNDILEGK